MIVIIAVGLVLSLGIGALLSFVVPVNLPLSARCGYYDCYCGIGAYVLDAAFWAFIIMAFFMVVALIYAIARRKKKENNIELLEKLDELNANLDDRTGKLKTLIEAKPANPLEQEMAQMKSTLDSVLQEAMDRNETVPLLKKQNAEAEEAKTKLAVSLKEKCSRLTELSIENERLEKNNDALRKVIDDALDPYCNKLKTGEFQSSEYRCNDYRSNGSMRPPNFNPNNPHSHE